MPTLKLMVAPVVVVVPVKRIMRGDLFTTSRILECWRAKWLGPLGSPDHFLVRSTLPLTCFPRPRIACYRGWYYKSVDWDGMRSFFAFYPWRQYCFLPDNPNTTTDSVADVVLEGIDHFIPSSVVPIGGKCRTRFGPSSKKPLPESLLRLAKPGLTQWQYGIKTPAF